MIYIWVTYLVDHFLLKSPFLVSMTIDAPGFLFKSWEVLLTLPYGFLFLCLYFGSECSPRILILAVFSSAHLGELALSFSQLGNFLALIKCMLNNTYLYLCTQSNCLQDSLHSDVLDIWNSVYPRLKFFLLQPSLVFFIKDLEYHHQKILSLTKLLSSSELSSQREFSFGFCVCLCPILARIMLKTV